MHTLVRLAPMLLVIACNDKGDDSGGTYDPAGFPGGSFQFTSYAVDDGCLDGGFEALLLPEGAGTTNDWAYPIDLYAWDDLPQTYTIDIQDPFTSMEVTVQQGGSAGTLVVNGAEQTDVEYDDASAPGCLVDMEINVDITIDSDTEVHGTATMTTGSFDEKNCPVPEDDPCDLVLDFTGVAL